MTRLLARPGQVDLGAPGLAYGDPEYTASLGEFGRPRELTNCDGSILVRPVPGSDSRLEDAMSPYPLFRCRNWAELEKDVSDLAPDLVSLTLVTDPLGDYEPADLRASFEICLPFKKHYLVDLSKPIDEVVSAHHRKVAQTALDVVSIDLCPPATALEEWTRLFQHLIDRHRITGLRRFSERAFTRQLALAGSVVLRARLGERTVGMDWYLRTPDAIYGHLAAFDQDGYRLSASYALQWRAIELFHGLGTWLDLGAGAGLMEDPDDGLSRFKRGWSSDSARTFLCGKIFDPVAYRALCETTYAGSKSTSRYFPAYRRGEFQ